MSLTDVDKQWFEALFAASVSQMDARLGRVGQQFETTIADTASEAYPSHGVGRAQSEDRFAARLERFETTLVAEIRTWGTSMEFMLQEHDVAIDRLKAKLASLKERVQKIEDENK
jgi:uncharacterized coiled-coil protein SlyX